MSHGELDPRFCLVRRGQLQVLELSSEAGHERSKGAKGDAAKVAGGSGKRDKKASDEVTGGAGADAAAMGATGKPPSKKELRVLERQKQEVRECVAGVH